MGCLCFSGYQIRFIGKNNKVLALDEVIFYKGANQWE